MRIAIALPVLIFAAVTASAQDFDPAVAATGWSRSDADGSFTFYDAGGRRLVTWSRDTGRLGQVDLAKLEGNPEFWVIDSYGNAWVVVGASLTQVDKKGKILNRVKLPAAVADLAWDPRGMLLAYRGSEAIVEKREYKNGQVQWSWSGGPSGASGPCRLAVTSGSGVAVARGAAMKLELLDLQSGKAIRQLAFAYKGLAAPDLESGSERGPMAWSPGLGVLFAAVPGSQAPHAKMNGQLLARLDLASQVLEFLPTGLTEEHLLLGILESEAVFLKPKGGLAFVPVR